MHHLFRSYAREESADEDRTTDPEVHLARGQREHEPKLAEIGRTADESGFSSIWMMDHFFQIEMVGEAEEPMWRATAP